MKKLTSLVLAVVLLFLFTFPNVASADSGSLTVNATAGLNMRTGPGTDNAIITTLNHGTKVNYTNTQNGWYQVSFNGRTGWVIGTYVITTPTVASTPTPAPTPEPAPTPSNTGSLTVQAQLGVNMRSGPGTNYGVITTLAHLTKLNYTKVENNWYQVSYNGRTGWISGTYVNATPSTTPTPTPAPTPEPEPAPTPAPDPVQGTLKVIATAGLNVRSLPSTSGVRLGTLPYNSSATYVGVQNGWYQINYGNSTGWVSGDWVTTGTYTAPAPGENLASRQEQWLNWAVGKFIDREGDGVSWCTELTRQYAMDLFGTEAGLHMGNGNQQIYTGSSTYFEKIFWDRNNPATYPKRGDIITFTGAIYAAGHAAIVLEEQPDPNGQIKVLTTSWGSPYTAAQVVHMAYSDAFNGSVIGMLRPIQTKINASHTFGTR